jgi:hypothetical protein
LYPIIHPLNYYRTGQLAIDKAAATRFIKNAIAQANNTIPTNASNTGPGPATTTHPHIGDESGNGNANDKTNDARFPTKITEKMLEREKYLEALREEAQLASDEDEEHLEIIDNDDGDEHDGDEQEEKDEGKANAAAVASPIPIPEVSPPPSAGTRKRRRPAIDPFAGLCGSLISSCFSFPSYHNFSLPQVLAIVQIHRPVPLQQRPQRLILHQALRVLAGRFEEPVKRTSALIRP